MVEEVRSLGLFTKYDQSKSLKKFVIGQEIICPNIFAYITITIFNTSFLSSQLPFHLTYITSQKCYSKNISNNLQSKHIVILIFLPNPFGLAVFRGVFETFYYSRVFRVYFRIFKSSRVFKLYFGIFFKH